MWNIISSIYRFLFEYQFFCVHVWFLIILIFLSILLFAYAPKRTFVPALPQKRKIKKGWKAIIIWGSLLVCFGIFGYFLNQQGVQPYNTYDAYRYFYSQGFFENLYKYKVISLGMLSNYSYRLCIYGAALLFFSAVFSRLERRLQVPPLGCIRNSPKWFLCIANIISTLLPAVITIFWGDHLVFLLTGLDDASGYIQSHGNFFQVSMTDAYYFQSVSIYLSSFMSFALCYIEWLKVINARNYGYARVTVGLATFPIFTLFALLFTRLIYGIVALAIPIGVLVMIGAFLGSGRSDSSAKDNSVTDPYAEFLWDQYRFKTTYEERIDMVKDMSSYDRMTLTSYIFDHCEYSDLRLFERDVEESKESEQK